MSYFRVYWGSGKSETFHDDSLDKAFERYYGNNAVAVAQGVEFYTEGRFEHPEEDYEHDGARWSKKGEKRPNFNNLNSVELTPAERIGRDLASLINDFF